MSIRVTYQSLRYEPARVTRRYVRYDKGDGEYHFAEVNVDGLDIRQGTVTRDDLPVEIGHRAQAASIGWPSYVEWPLNPLKTKQD